MMHPYIILSATFYKRSAALVAKALLGKLLVRKIHGKYFVGRIVETEAYLGENDPASHSFKGKTIRNASMFKSFGCAYVYRLRHHTLFNVVTEAEHKGSAVLIRALEPMENTERPPRDNGAKNAPLMNGPAKLAKALSITHALDGISLTDPHGEIFLAQGKRKTGEHVVTTTRIGISKGKELLLRFYLEGNTHVSRYKKDKKKKKLST